MVEPLGGLCLRLVLGGRQAHQVVSHSGRLLLMLVEKVFSLEFSLDAVQSLQVGLAENGLSLLTGLACKVASYHGALAPLIFILSRPVENVLNIV